MGYKSVCLSCRKAFSQGIDFTKFQSDKLCPDCGKSMAFLSQRFRPPKKTDDKKWDVVEFLVENGFYYDHILETIYGGFYVEYPETLKEAKEFVEKYKAQARKKTE
jgi:predicted RNA-binding Zn-ribbon protein involved in translation (DUF1610 family)